MTKSFPPNLTEALRLTRTGNLREATALIQATLAGVMPGARSARAVVPGPVIDLTPDRVTVSTPRSKAAAQEAPRPVPPSGAPGSFEERRYTGPAGDMTYRLYRPASAAAGMPLVVMLHGCTQSPEDFAKGTGMNRLADELGFLVAYPAQSRSANAQGCWNWFKPGHQQRDRGEPALIAAITRQVVAEQGADAARVYVAGLSAGGAAAAIMGAAYPDLYAAIGVHSGLASGAARDLAGALQAMRSGGRGGASATGARFVPVITFHGDRDATVHATNSADIIAAALAAADGPLKTQTESGRSEGGRRYTRETSVADDGQVRIEQWTIHDAGHAWSGGDASGSYTDPAGPDASRAMLRFFLSHRLASGGNGAAR